MNPNNITIPVRLLRRCDTNSVAFAELCESVKKDGVLVPVLVTPLFELIDGLHRTLAARKEGVEIPFHVIDCSDEQVLLLQLIPNVHRVPVDRVSIAKHLRRMLDQDPEMTMAKLAGLTKKSIAWVSQQLSLEKLPQEAVAGLSRGTLSVKAAYQLARLPESLQSDWLAVASQLPPAEFTARVSAFLQQNANATRKKTEHTFSDHPVLRSRREIITRLASSRGEFQDALKWVLQIDPKSLLERKNQFETRN